MGDPFVRFRTQGLYEKFEDMSRILFLDGLCISYQVSGKNLASKRTIKRYFAYYSVKYLVYKLGIDCMGMSKGSEY